MIRLDILGSVLLMSGTVALMLVLTLGGARLPWTSPILLALGVAAGVLAAALIVHLRRAPEGLIPLGISCVFRKRSWGRPPPPYFFDVRVHASTVYV